jgi:hypothetical protein
MSPEDFAEHERTYRAFARGVFAVAVLALLGLVMLSCTFSGSFGMPELSS